MAFDRAAAKAAGYTDEEIDEYLRRKQDTTNQTYAQPSAEPPVPSTVIPEISRSAEMATTAGLGLGPAVATGAGIGAGAYGAYKMLPKVVDLGQRMLGGGQAPGPVDLRGQMAGARNIPVTATPPAPGPVAPGTMPPATPPAAQPAAQPGVIDRAADTIRQLAASRAMQGVSKIAGAAGAALTPGNIGQNYPFPTSGPLRGSEINPATGRPWTPQELAAYRRQYGQ